MFSGWHPRLESALVLSLPKMQAQGVIAPDSERAGAYAWRDSYGDELYRVQYHSRVHDAWGALDLTDDAGTYKIMLGSTPLHFGGRRWWMHCPFTSKRALKLYRYECLGKFCHRTAIRPLPTYASQRVSGIDRLQSRRWALRRKLNDPSTLEEPLNKPRGMHRRTFEPYQQLDEILATQEDAALWARFGRLGIFG